MKKLTKEQIKAIEANRNGSASKLCKEYGICRRQVYYIWQQAERRKLMTIRKAPRGSGATHILTISITPKAYAYLNRFPNKSMAIRSILERLADIDDGYVTDKQ